jgi:transposase
METMMGVKQARRLGLVEAALRGEISNREGAERLGASLRQFKRWRARVRQRGAAGLVHGNRDRPSPRRLPEPVRTRIEDLLTRPAVRLNDHHISDLLHEEGRVASADTVRRIRRRLGLPAKRRRRPRPHRRRRERRPQAGAMVLIDGSPFRWLGEAQPEHCLVGTLDDASGHILALELRPEEDLHGFTTVLRETLVRYGLCGVLYGDRTSIAVRNDPYWSVEEELAGRQFPPQFGRMLEELGIRYIPAGSAEAKGRIERLWGTLQDRLVAELALHGITTLAGAQAYLPRFIARYNRRFGHAPRQTPAAWRPAPPALDRILACRYLRVVARDDTVAFFGAHLQLPPGPGGSTRHRTQVEVRELLDGRRLVLHQDRVVLECPAPPGPFTLMPRDGARARRCNGPQRSGHNQVLLPPPVQESSVPPPPDRLRPRPTADHPWRRPFKPELARTHPATQGVSDSLRR